MTTALLSLEPRAFDANDETRGAGGTLHSQPRFDRLRPGLIIAERYELLHLLASGGMATIWEAMDTVLERVVALKVLGDAYVDQADFRERFAREAKVAARVRTRYTAQIYDHGGSDDIAWIAMERLYGEDLHQRLERAKRLPISFVVKVVREAGAALKVAHDAGITHRDLKPQNLFLAREGDQEIVKLLDFGVAKDAASAARATGVGVTMGTASYMSPEQFRGEPSIDGRTDLWSFAIILYRTLTGHRPFEGNALEALSVGSCVRATPPTALFADLPAPLDAFFAKALAPSKEDRHANVVEFMDCFCAIVEERDTPRASKDIDDDRDSSPTIRVEPEELSRQLDTRVELTTSPVPVGLQQKLSVSGRRDNHTGLRLGTPSGLPPPPPPLPAPSIDADIDIEPRSFTAVAVPNEASKPPPPSTATHASDDRSAAGFSAPFCDPRVVSVASAWLVRPAAIRKRAPRDSWPAIALVCASAVVTALLVAAAWFR